MFQRIGGERRVLLVAADRGVMFVVHKRRGARAYVFPIDDAGLASFQRFLRQTQPTPVHVLIDLVEEEYRHDTIPHVGGADRRSVLKRKFARLFRGTKYTLAIPQGREHGGRRDDRMLLTAITRPELVTPWVNSLHQLKVPLAGITSTPILSERLLPIIGAKGENILLISIQHASGLRQTFFRNRKLKISRLAQMPASLLGSHADYVLGELDKLRRYLNSLALVAGDAPLNVYIICHGELLSALQHRCKSTEHERYSLVDSAGLATRLGAKLGAESSYSDGLLAQLLIDSPPQHDYADVEERRYFTLHRTQRVLQFAAVAMLLVASALSALNFLDGINFKSQALDSAQKTSFYHDRYAIARGQLPPTPIEPRKLKAAVDIASFLHHRKSSPFTVLKQFGDTLTGHDRIVLDSVSWFASDNSEIDQLTERSEKNLSETAFGERFSHFHVGVFRAHLADFNGDYRAAMRDIDGLVANLRARDTLTEVSVIEYPLDLSSRASVKGNAARGPQRQEANFAIKLIIGVPHATQGS